MGRIRWTTTNLTIVVVLVIATNLADYDSRYRAIVLFLLFFFE